MDWDRIESNWKQLRGNVKAQWGKITEDQLDGIAGRREQLAGRIQSAYGVTADAASRQLDVWQKSLKDDYPPKAADDEPAPS